MRLANSWRHSPGWTVTWSTWNSRRDTVAELRGAQDKFPGVAIAADEALRRDRQFTAVSDFADVAVVKVAPIGGVSAVREMVKT